MKSRVLALIYKEFLALWRDKKSRTILILPPLTQLFIFAFAATLDVNNVTIGISNRDNGEKGFELVQRFHGSPTFSHIHYLPTSDEISHFIDNQRGVMVLSLDEHFSRDIDAGKNAEVQFILDGRKSNTTQIVAGYAQQIVEQFVQDIREKEGIVGTKVELIPSNKYNPNLIYLWFTVPGLLGILTLLETLVITALSVAREKELETFDQLLVSPLTSTEILVGKAIPAALIGLAAGTVILLAAVFIFGIPFTGSLLALYTSMFVYICTISGIGLFLSSLCSTQQQAILAGFVFMTPAVILSGFATPIENMPQWLQYVTYINPVRYFLIISRGLFLKEMPIDIVFMNTWPMAIMALGTLTGAGFFFHRKLQ